MTRTEKLTAKERCMRCKEPEDAKCRDYFPRIFASYVVCSRYHMHVTPAHRSHTKPRSEERGMTLLKHA